jgi:hypothetical protein
MADYASVMFKELSYAKAGYSEIRRKMAEIVAERSKTADRILLIRKLLAVNGWGSDECASGVFGQET